MVFSIGTIVSHKLNGVSSFPIDITVIYTNLLIFIAVIFLFSIASPAESPSYSFLVTLAIYGASLVGFWLLVKKAFANPQARGTEGYFNTEKKLSIAALLFFAML